jgi:dimeric dUTPase (all-alpha-NTP-PPase superfamily)
MYQIICSTEKDKIYSVNIFGQIISNFSRNIAELGKTHQIERYLSILSHFRNIEKICAAGKKIEKRFFDGELSA